MKCLPLQRTAVPSSRALSLSAFIHWPRPTMSEQTTIGNNFNKKEKRPPLTHFLCLPLMNVTSLPQLEASLAKFRTDIPPRQRTENDHPLQPRPPLFPDSAIRPVGTLHLTLGVMSLSTRERLEAAIKLLHSLDLASMLREAELQARKFARRGGSLATPMNVKDPNLESEATSEAEEDDGDTGQEIQSQMSRLEPISLSLESLHALPRARSATVLYASPVDPTFRLHSFGVILRDKFLEAGLLEGEYKKSKNGNHHGRNDTGKANQIKQNDTHNSILAESASGPDAAAIQQSLLEEIPRGIAEDPIIDGTRLQTKAQKLKPRPLLLHATVVNTIYSRSGRWGNNGSNNNTGRKGGLLTFDARDIISRYKDYYLDETRARSRPPPTNPTPEQVPLNPSGEDDQNTSEDDNVEELGENQQQQQQKYPFIWARNFFLEKLCICEMGAKKLDDNNGNGLATRLGQEYRVVAERSLLNLGQDREEKQQDSEDENRNSLDGGVSLEGAGR